MTREAKSVTDLGRAPGRGDSRNTMRDRNLHATQSVVTSSEKLCMPITLDDFFEDKVTAHIVQLEDGMEVDSVMNITTAVPGLEAKWMDAEQEPLLTMWILSFLGMKWIGLKLLSTSIILAGQNSYTVITSEAITL